ncbi:MAG: hypothetical protein P4L46_19650 [Fimbriimonas sp.]|nr:hypothetical protein [Fimbriimonas sp.]
METRLAMQVGLDKSIHPNPVILFGEADSYIIQASDGGVRPIGDFLLFDDTWAIGYVVTKRRNWIPANQKPIAPRWVEQAIWDESGVFASIAQEVVTQASAYDDLQNCWGCEPEPEEMVL